MGSASTLPDCDHSVYTRCYCEENIYLLIQRFLNPSGGEQQWDVFSVFISNPTRTVALWNQRTGSSRDNTAVIWDYHVVLALRERLQVGSRSCHLTSGRGTWIYDLDTCLPAPCHWEAYVDETFPLGAGAPLQYQSLFRVIPGETYLDNFASDRSHMLDVSLSNTSEGPLYLSKPPPYPVICGPEAEKRGVKHNLESHFVSMIGDGQGFGTVMDFDGFTTWCSGSLLCDMRDVTPPANERIFFG